MLPTVCVHRLKLALIVLMSTQLGSQTPPTYRVESKPVTGGAELLTILRHQDGTDDVPLVSVLRDTLGDQNPENDRLRYVWILTSARPSLVQRVASVVPFAYFRLGKTGHDSKKDPKPVLDLATPTKGLGSKLLSDGLQVLQLDSMGALVRSSTRTYRGNLQDYHQLQISKARSAVEQLLRQPGSQHPLSEAQLRQIYSRLQLSNRMLGGLVREESLVRFYDRHTFQSLQIRAKNWELLRQRAELCGLYFDPLLAADGEAKEVLLWIARGDLENAEHNRFNSWLLDIANPWTDNRLRQWTGYSQIRYFDPDGHRVPAETPNAQPHEMIPLALYSVEYPRVPLLLVDFRDTLKPKRRELASQGANMILSGVLGVTRFSSWPFLAASLVWNFARTRHGATLDRTSRLEAYSGAHALLNGNSTLDPGLKIELQTRLQHLALNPLENADNMEDTVARAQYLALLRYAQAPNGLQAKLNRDRQKELTDYGHSRGAQILMAAGRLFDGGPRVSSEHEAVLCVQLDSRRRIAHHISFLNALLSSSPRPEVVWNSDDIRKSIEALEIEPETSREASHVIAQLLKVTQDSQLRIACLRALGNSKSEQARKELKRLVEDPSTSESLRMLCFIYFNGGVDETVATGEDSVRN